MSYEFDDKLNEVLKGKYDVNRFFVELKKEQIDTDRIVKELVINMLPVRIIIETIRGCNLRCPLCRLQVDERVQDRGVMSEEIYNKAVNDLVNLNTINEYILYHRGEPFLDPRIIDRIKKIKELTTAIVCLDSNFSLDINPFDIVESGLDIINVAVDGFTQETYSKYRIGGDLDKVISNISRVSAVKKILNSRTPKLIAKTILFKHVIEEADLAKELAMQAGADETMTQFAVVPIESNENPKNWIPENADYSRYNTEELYQNDNFISKLSYISGLSSCRGILGTIHPVIDYLGNVYPCCFIYDTEFIMGNIKKNSFKEIWFSDKYINFRFNVIKDRGKYEVCKHCYRLCFTY